MMRLLKKKFALLLAVVLCLGLTACGGSSEEAAETTPEDASGNEVWVMTAGEQPFANVETLQSETNEDGTYYYEDMAEDGLIKVVNTVQPRDFSAEDTEAYLLDCALALGEADADSLVSFEANEAYTQQMTFPVYVATYTTGENEDTREWAVFAMDTDLYTYLYGISVTMDAAEDMRDSMQDVFASLYLSEPV